jgi:16S rRNA (cytidine1402-2'-O)-methyltransferase
MPDAASRGTLYLVATPIGNLEDITLRAVRILREASVVGCEDTRRTRGLLSHLGITTRTLSLHEHNERARIAQIFGLLREGHDVALVSDAGTPAISDPGAALVTAAAGAGFRVVSIPGPSAVTAAVPLADFHAGHFAFLGFLPRKRDDRRRLLASMAGVPLALVIFEAPHRVLDTLDAIEAMLGERRIMLVRELTKIHEEVLRGTAREIRESLGRSPRGEITLVVAPPTALAARAGGDAAHAGAGPDMAPGVFVRRLLARGVSRRDAAAALEVAYAMPHKDAYRLATGVS